MSIFDLTIFGLVEDDQYSTPSPFTPLTPHPRYRQQVSNKKPTVVDKSELAKYTVCSVMDKVRPPNTAPQSLKLLLKR